MQRRSLKLQLIFIFTFNVQTPKLQIDER